MITIPIWVNVILLIAGLAMVVFGASYLVDGATGIARRFGMSEFIIGLTIVGMGTSAPEMVVSFIGAAEGNSDIAIGNVVGSNIMNALLILGLTAVILPMAITPTNRRLDIPVNIGITFLMIFLGLESKIFGIGSDGLSRWDGGILVLAFLLYIGWSIWKNNKAADDDEPDEKPVKIGIAILMVIGGLACLVFGGQLFVKNATAVAHALDLSDKFIAITVLAGGTSLPELATCVAAAVKKKGQLALGNIIGSNLFNILLILGGSALICPISFEHINLIDLGVLALSTIVLWTADFVGWRREIDRLDGSLYLVIWVAYMVWLFFHQL